MLDENSISLTRFVANNDEMTAFQSVLATIPRSFMVARRIGLSRST